MRTRTEVVVREVAIPDLPGIFEMQRDPDSVAMSGVPARDAEAFLAHWGKAAADPDVVWLAVDADGELAGHVLSFRLEGRRMVGYWLAREYWGRGIASRALGLLLERLDDQPLYAIVSASNGASRRILEKAGFAVAEDRGEELLLVRPRA